ITASSFRPTRRLRISSLPAAVSKNHRPSLFFFRGIGKGKLSAPTTSTCDPSSILRQRCIASYRLTNAVTAFLSCTGSPEYSTSFDSGPKIARSAFWSPAFAAVCSALAASLGVAYPVISDLFDLQACGRIRATINNPDASTTFLALIDIGPSEPLVVRSTPAYRRNPPPPRLNDPRLLSALDCHPLLLPPNAPDPLLF